MGWRCGLSNIQHKCPWEVWNVDCSCHNECLYVGKQWKDGAPFGLVLRASENGWINRDLFLEFGHHFVKYLKSELWTMDFRTLSSRTIITHVFNLEFLNLMRSNNVHVFALPSHRTHWLQLLDRVPFGTFKGRWNEEMRMFTKNHAGRKLEKSVYSRVAEVDDCRACSVWLSCNGSFSCHCSSSPRGCIRTKQGVWTAWTNVCII